MGPFAALKKRLHTRAHKRGLHGQEHVNKQREIALWSVLFQGSLTLVWLISMVLMGLHFVVDVAWINGFYQVCQAVAFVTFISLYCNFATNLGGTVAGIAALFSSDAHHDAERTRQTVEVDSSQIEQDLARLADLQPGPEARALAASIRERLR